VSEELRCFLAEWYRSEFTDESLEQTASRLNGSAAAMSADGSSVHLLTMLAVPTDEVVFALFAAESETAVASTCNRAGLPVERLSAATDIPIPRLYE
jgi:hypothetical protein